MRFAKEAWPFVLPPAIVGVALVALDKTSIGIATIVLALLLLLFFRVPNRPVNADDETVLAPANGRITRVDIIEDSSIGVGRFHRIVTFLSVFDIHVQRAPVSGRVVKSEFFAGKKVAAFREDAGVLNEQVLTVVKRPNDDLVAIRQIAGLVARRVVTYLKKHQDISKGDLIGVIKFGSRVDLLLPESYEVQVEVGMRITEGETIVALQGDK